MIIGTGIDSVQISRVEELISRYGERFLKRTSTDDEIAEGMKRHRSAHFFAARFAAREAFFKALGTGWGRGISLKEVRIATAESGQPNLRFSGRLELILRSRGIDKTHLSLTHEGDYALAIVILESVKGE